MTAPDPEQIAARIFDETGIDVRDPVAADAASSIAARRVWRQIAGLFGGVVLVSVAAILIGMAATDSADYGTGGRVALGVIGALFAGGAVWTWFRAFRPSRAYREVYLPRQVAVRRFLAEIGQPWNPLGNTDRLERAALIAYSTPSEVRDMKAAEQAARDRAAGGQPPSTEPDQRTDPETGP